MDTLALLCNLHADGPATLQRLRQEGCDSLDALLELEASTLCGSLDWTEEFSQRFLREALVLSERLGESMAWEISEEVMEEFEAGAESEGRRETEPTESTDLGGEDGPYTVDELLDASGPAGEDSPEEYEYVLVDEEEDEEEDEEAVPRADPAAVQELVAVWRTLDDSDPPLRPDEARVEHGVVAYDDEELRDYVVEPGQGSPNRPLARVELAGLDRKLVHRLAQLGIHSLGGLVEAPTTALARRLSMPFTRLRRLQFLARRELASAPPAIPIHDDSPTTGTPGPSSAGPFA